MAEPTHMITVDQAHKRVMIAAACAVTDFGYPSKLTTTALIEFELWQNRYSNLLLGCGDQKVQEFESWSKEKRLQVCERLKLLGVNLDIAPTKAIYAVYEQNYPIG